MPASAQRAGLAAGRALLLVLLLSRPSWCPAAEDPAQRTPAQTQQAPADTLLPADPGPAQTEHRADVRVEPDTQELLSRVEAVGATLASYQARASRVTLRGENHIRVQSVSADRALIEGAYEEVVQRGLTVTYRLAFETEVRILESLSTGGMVRLSNEGTLSFETGPRRLASERGSAFVRYRAPMLMSDFGYYDLHLTPLTLMWWDAEDSPQGGGAAGCGTCPGSGGAITAERLEELAPDMTFEGVKLKTAAGEHGDLLAFLARSRSAQEDQWYRQRLLGARARWLVYHRPSASFGWLGLTCVSDKDDKSSVGYAPYAPGSNTVLDLDLRFPVGKGLLFKGEWAHTETDENLLSQGDDALQGFGAIATVEVRYPSRALTRLSYQRISPQYRSLYDALSYSANREGFRISSDCEVLRGKCSLWGFYKRLGELESTAWPKDTGVLKRFTTSALGVSWNPSKSLTLRAHAMLRSEARDEDAATPAAEEIARGTLVATLQAAHAFAPGNDLTFTYQRIRHTDDLDSDEDYHADLVSALFSTRF